MRGPVAGLVLALFASSVAIAQTPPITKLEARSQAPEITKRRILSQLGDVLRGDPRAKPGARRPVMPLSDLWYETVPRTANHRGLCVYNQIVFQLQPVTRPAKGAATPVRVRGVTSTTKYRFSSSPQAVEGGERSPGDADDRACGGLNPRQANFFEAADEDIAIEGGVRLQIATAAVAVAGPMPFSLSCAPGMKTDCRRLVAGLGLDDVYSIERGDGPSEDPMASCWTLEISRDGFYRVRLCGPYGASRLTQVKVDEEVVVADERRD